MNLYSLITQKNLHKKYGDFSIFFQKTIDNHIIMWYNIITGKRMKGGDKMEDKIKKLIKVLEHLNKLLLKVVELVGTITLLILSIKGIIDII